jgi:uncharacterized protein with von Willebrand factor type A (vWA) domain
MKLLRKPATMAPKGRLTNPQFYMSHPDHKEKFRAAFREQWPTAPDDIDEIVFQNQLATRMLAEEPVSVQEALEKENLASSRDLKQAYFDALQGEPSDKPEDIIE